MIVVDYIGPFLPSALVQECPGRDGLGRDARPGRQGSHRGDVQPGKTINIIFESNLFIRAERLEANGQLRVAFHLRNSVLKLELLKDTPHLSKQLAESTG